MMEAARTSETSVDNHFTRQYIPEDNSELHTRRRENLKSHMDHLVCTLFKDTVSNGNVTCRQIFLLYPNFTIVQYKQIAVTNGSRIMQHTENMS
jgi:hypothetical protein